MDQSFKKDGFKYAYECQLQPFHFFFKIPEKSWV